MVSSFRRKMSTGRGQSAIEFVILMSFALLFMGFLVVIIQNNIVASEATRREARVNQVMNIIYAELSFAEQSPSIYTRTFYLPTNIDGVDYNITAPDGYNVNGGREIIIRYLAKDYIFFLPLDLVWSKNLTLGTNTIRKTCSTFSCKISII